VAVTVAAEEVNPAHRWCLILPSDQREAGFDGLKILNNERF
jgi:hypothetical protein